MKKLLTLITILICAVSLNAQVPPTEGLISWYPFSGNAQDNSGNGYNCVVNGAILTTDRFNNDSSAYYFDGLNDTITCELGIYKKMSVSMWYKSPYPTNWYPFMFDYGVLSFSIREYGNHPYWIGNINGMVGFQTLDDSPYIPFIRSTYNPTFDQWHHVVCMYDSSLNINKLYIDGVFNKDTIVTTSLNPISGHTKFGCRSILGGGDGSFYYTGFLDDIRIYNRVLTDSEITDLFIENPYTYSTKDIIVEKITIFPNPSSTGNMKIKTVDNIQKIIIYNSLGSVIKFELVNTNEHLISLSQGTYFVKIVTVNYCIIKKIIFI